MALSRVFPVMFPVHIFGISFNVGIRLIERFRAKYLLLVFYRSLLSSLYLGAKFYDNELMDHYASHQSKKSQ